MQYDIIFISGEKFIDHPMNGFAILKRLLEEKNYSIAIIEEPQSAEDIKQFGEPKLFFGLSSGAIDSMLRNYTPLKKLRSEDVHSKYSNNIPKRALILYSNWIKQFYKESKIVLGGTEASLRRFTHYDYWDNKLRKPILLDTRADILVYGNGEKQIIEIANKLKSNKPLIDIEGTCIISNEFPENFQLIPSFKEVSESKEKFCEMQNSFNINKNLAQEVNKKFILQYKSPKYTSKDLDYYYELPFDRIVPKELFSFRNSIVTHRGCIGECNFCSIKLTQGNKVISRSEESILRELNFLANQPNFNGIIDDFGGPSANMYGMNCNLCDNSCIEGCKKLDKTHNKLIQLLRKARKIKGIKKIYIKSGIRFDLANEEYINEITKYHISDFLRIAPEHTNKNILKLMNKNKGNLQEFIKMFEKNSNGKKLSFYFITAHPGSSLKEAEELSKDLKHLENSESVQIFTPTPMTISTCMYYTGLNPITKEKVYIPYTYNEKKKQKNIIFN